MEVSSYVCTLCMYVCTRCESCGEIQTEVLNKQVSRFAHKYVYLEVANTHLNLRYYPGSLSSPPSAMTSTTLGVCGLERLVLIIRTGAPCDRDVLALLLSCGNKK